MEGLVRCRRRVRKRGGGVERMGEKRRNNERERRGGEGNDGELTWDDRVDEGGRDGVEGKCG